MLAHSLRFVCCQGGRPPPRGSRCTTKASMRWPGTHQRQRAGGGLHPVGRVDVVLDEQGDAVQRPAHALLFPLPVQYASAAARASGLTSITLLMAGPCLSIASMRARYFSVRERAALNFPGLHPILKSSAMVKFVQLKRLDLGGDVLAGPRASSLAARVAAVAAPDRPACRKRRRVGPIAWHFC